MQDDGVLAKIVAKDESVQVGELVAYTVEDKDAYEEVLAKGENAFADLAPSSPEMSETSLEKSPSEDTEAGSLSSTPPRASPAASHWIRRESIDIKSLKGTGKHGGITKSDVINALKSGNMKNFL